MYGLRVDKAFFLDVQKAVWRDGLWLKLCDLGVRGRIWRVIKKMYESSRSAVLLEGEQSAASIFMFAIPCVYRVLNKCYVNIYLTLHNHRLNTPPAHHANPHS